jgi:hypothetical protein
MSHDTNAWSFPRDPIHFVSASFDDLDDALDATRDLEAHEYPRDRISMFMGTGTRERYIDTHPRYGEIEDRAIVVEEVELEKHRRTAEGAGTGGAIGAALGAAGAALAAAGTTLVVPPLGVVVAGPAAAALAGLGAGAATGGLVGALVGAGMSEYRAQHFAKLVKDGRVIVGVHVETEPEHHNVAEILDDHGGEVVSESS